MINTTPGNMFGTILRGRFEIHKCFRYSRMHTLYLGEDRLDGRMVVIKQTPFRAVDTPEALEIQRCAVWEARVLRTLTDPRTPQVRAAFREHGSFWLVLSYVPGVTVDEWIAHAKPGMRARRECLLQLCQIIATIHDQRMVHRDLKPQNILMTPHGHVVLIDFGLARPIDPAYRPLAPMGTPHYAPTEQWLGVLDPRIDVYALGVVAEELFAGLPIPVAADQVIAQAQATTPAQRFADVTSFGRALLAALHPHPHWRRYIPAWSRRSTPLPPRQRSAAVGV
ncbi:MAG: hypothetical protein Fur005_38270 [Roseiflexaceae bacterium]